MAEYIEKNKIREALLDWSVCLNNPETLSRSDAMFVIDNTEAADVAPVVHGRWGMHSDRPDTLICSICDHAFDVWKHDVERMHYCPNCGAKMNAEKEEPANEKCDV